MKGYSTLPKTPELENHHQIIFLKKNKKKKIFMLFYGNKINFKFKKKSVNTEITQGSSRR